MVENPSSLVRNSMLSCERSNRMLLLRFEGIRAGMLTISPSRTSLSTSEVSVSLQFQRRRYSFVPRGLQLCRGGGVTVRGFRTPGCQHFALATRKNPVDGSPVHHNRLFVSATLEQFLDAEINVLGDGAVLADKIGAEVLFFDLCMHTSDRTIAAEISADGALAARNRSNASRYSLRAATNCSAPSALFPVL